MADITIVNGVYKPTYNWGAPPCTRVSMKIYEHVEAHPIHFFFYLFPQLWNRYKMHYAIHFWFVKLKSTWLFINPMMFHYIPVFP